jgi:hypothetical protein
MEMTRRPFSLFLFSFAAAAMLLTLATPVDALDPVSDTREFIIDERYINWKESDVRNSKMSQISINYDADLQLRTGLWTVATHSETVCWIDDSGTINKVVRPATLASGKQISLQQYTIRSALNMGYPAPSVCWYEDIDILLYRMCDQENQEDTRPEFIIMEFEVDAMLNGDYEIYINSNTEYGEGKFFDNVAPLFADVSTGWSTRDVDVLNDEIDYFNGLRAAYAANNATDATIFYGYDMEILNRCQYVDDRIDGETWTEYDASVNAAKASGAIDDAIIYGETAKLFLLGFSTVQSYNAGLNATYNCLMSYVLASYYFDLAFAQNRYDYVATTLGESSREYLDDALALYESKIAETIAGENEIASIEPEASGSDLADHWQIIVLAGAGGLLIIGLLVRNPVMILVSSTACALIVYLMAG